MRRTVRARGQLRGALNASWDASRIPSALTAACLHPRQLRGARCTWQGSGGPPPRSARRDHAPRPRTSQPRGGIARVDTTFTRATIRTIRGSDDRHTLTTHPHDRTSHAISSARLHVRRRRARAPTVRHAQSPLARRPPSDPEESQAPRELGAPDCRLHVPFSSLGSLCPHA